MNVHLAHSLHIHLERDRGTERGRGRDTEEEQTERAKERKGGGQGKEVGRKGEIKQKINNLIIMSYLELRNCIMLPWSHQNIAT